MKMVPQIFSVFILILCAIATNVMTIPLASNGESSMNATTSENVLVTLVNATKDVAATTPNASNNTTDTTIFVTPITTTAESLEATAAPLVTKNADGHIDRDQELETAATEGKEKQIIGMAVPESIVAAASNLDPSVYSNFLTPELLQHYLNNYATAYAPPYAPTGYPAPVGYGYMPTGPSAPGTAPLYPANPYVVQTGYEGYLLPSAPSAPAATTGITTASGNTSPISTLLALLNPITLLSNLFPAFANLSIFRVFAALISIIGMVFFGGAITSAICSLTPLCDIIYRPFTLLRHPTSVRHMGNMIAEGVTPERIRRATEFVHNAIRKYQALQEFLDNESVEEDQEQDLEPFQEIIE